MNDSPNGLKANGRQAAPENRTTRPRKSAAVVILLCFVAIVFDGYDLIVYGATLPSLIAEPGLRWASLARMPRFIIVYLRTASPTPCCCS